MPRLNNARYLSQRRALAIPWGANTQVFGFLGYLDQRHLHDYFRFSENLSDAEAIKHRRLVSAARPSLPQCAGRALARLSQQRSARESSVDTRRGGLVVAGVVAPTIDVDRVAQVLVNLALERAAGDRDRAA